MTDPRHIAANLRRWRQARGKSQAEVADAIGVSRSTYRNMETDEAPTDIRQIAALATTLSVDINELLRPVVELKGVRFRSHKSLKMRDHILSEVSHRLGAYHQIEKILTENKSQVTDGFEKSWEKIESDGLVKPIERVQPSIANTKDSILRAEDLRNSLGLRPHEAIRNIFGLIESMGIKVLLEPVQAEGFFGLAVKEEPGPAVVVATWARLSVERWIFSAAHELGHLLMHDSFNDSSYLENAVEEEEANVFAAEFLMPQDAFEHEWNRRSGMAFVDRVLSVKTFFSVSYKTVLYRLQQMFGSEGKSVWQIFNAQHLRMYKKSLGGHYEPNYMRPEAFFSPLRADEPGCVTADVLVPSHLGRLVHEARQQNLVSMSVAATALGISLAQMDLLESFWAEEPKSVYSLKK